MKKLIFIMGVTILMTSLFMMQVSSFSIFGKRETKAKIPEKAIDRFAELLDDKTKKISRKAFGTTLGTIIAEVLPTDNKDMLREIADTFVKNQNKVEYTIDEIKDYINNDVVTKFIDDWKADMKKKLIQLYELDENDKELMEDIEKNPEFYGIDYDTYKIMTFEDKRSYWDRVKERIGLFSDKVATTLHLKDPVDKTKITYENLKEQLKDKANLDDAAQLAKDYIDKARDMTKENADSYVDAALKKGHDIIDSLKSGSEGIKDKSSDVIDSIKGTGEKLLHQGTEYVEKIGDEIKGKFGEKKPEPKPTLFENIKMKASETVDSARGVADSVVGSVKSTASDVIDKTKGAFTKSSSTVEEAVDSVKEKATEIKDKAKEKTLEGYDRAKEKTLEGYDRTKEAGERLSDYVKEKSHEFADRAQDMVPDDTLDSISAEYQKYKEWFAKTERDWERAARQKMADFDKASLNKKAEWVERAKNMQEKTKLKMRDLREKLAIEL